MTSYGLLVVTVSLLLIISLIRRGICHSEIIIQLEKQISKLHDMGCKQSTIIPLGTLDTSKKSPNILGKEEEYAMMLLKSATEEDPETEIKKQTKIKVIQQLTENDTLKNSYVGNGGVAYNISLNDDNDSMLVKPACPEHIVRRMERPKTSFFSPEEKELMSDILKKHELCSKGNAAQLITIKQEKAKRRREEKQQMVAERYERKRKRAEERLKKLEQKKKEKLDNQLTDVI